MQYCTDGDKPIVKYKFGDGNYRYFKSDIAPIEIITKTVPIPNTDNYNNEGFLAQFERADNGTTAGLLLLDYRIEDVPPGAQLPPNSKYLYFQECGDKAFNPGPFVFILPTLTIDYSVKCPAARKTRCAIQIKSSDGDLIFQDQGDCACCFEIQCGNCPSGNIECKKSAYPGYCCIPCSDLANKIHNLANKVK
jgi:hypothetical protein